MAGASCEAAMPAAIEQLNLDHANIERLLALLERQMAVLHRGDPAEVAMLLDVMQYFGNYPELVHHPKENLIYGRMVEREPRVAGEIRNILEEHKTLTVMTDEFTDFVHRLSAGAAPRDLVEHRGHAFIAAYRQHIEIEEVELFPRALEVLRAPDWTEIDAAITASADPLFDDAVRRQYESLLDRIHRAGQ